MVALDLTSKVGCDISWDILESPGLGAVHMGLPCGTRSRANELPIPLAMRQAVDILDALTVEISLWGLL